MDAGTIAYSMGNGAIDVIDPDDVHFQIYNFMELRLAYACGPCIKHQIAFGLPECLVLATKKIRIGADKCPQTVRMPARCCKSWRRGIGPALQFSDPLSRGRNCPTRHREGKGGTRTRLHGGAGRLSWL